MRVAASLSSLRLLVLFGSMSRGTGQPRSDVDLGISLDDGDSRPQVEAALGRAAGRAVDIVDLTDSPPQLRFEIARDGRVLLERVPHAWADFRARAMIDWWDWAPTARFIHSAAIERLRQRTSHGQT